MISFVLIHREPFDRAKIGALKLLDSFRLPGKVSGKERGKKQSRGFWHTYSRDEREGNIT